MRKILSVAVLGAGALMASAASAQSWGDDGWHRGWDGDGVVHSVCSGDRAHRLEWRLQHEVSEREIGYEDAGRIHGVIDRLEDQQRHECREGDRGAIYRIAQRYDGIGQWIDREAHGGWDRRW